MHLWLHKLEYAYVAETLSLNIFLFYFWLSPKYLENIWRSKHTSRKSSALLPNAKAHFFQWSQHTPGLSNQFGRVERSPRQFSSLENLCFFFLLCNSLFFCPAPKCHRDPTAVVNYGCISFHVSLMVRPTRGCKEVDKERLNLHLRVFLRAVGLCVFFFCLFSQHRLSVWLIGTHFSSGRRAVGLNGGGRCSTDEDSV